MPGTYEPLLGHHVNVIGITLMITAPQAKQQNNPSVVIEKDSIFQKKRQIALITIWIPTIGTVVSLFLACLYGIDKMEISLLVGMYIATMVGVEVGLHRYFSHRAFKTTKMMKVLLAILGSMAAQGRILYWVSSHRRHHLYSDTADDPHSPHYRRGINGPEKMKRGRGLWHAQMGNMYTDHATNCTLFGRDLIMDPLLAWIDRTYLFWVFLGVMIPALIGGIYLRTALGAVDGFLWGGLVRIFVVHHAYFTNGSFSHMYGKRPFNNNDESTNNLWCAVPTFGSAYQNNHHAFPTAAVLGFKWWQIDIGAIFIRLFELLGLVHDVVRITPKQIARKLKDPQA